MSLEILALMLMLHSLKILLIKPISLKKRKRKKRRIKKMIKKIMTKND
jgi:hypothetical protein